MWIGKMDMTHDHCIGPLSVKKCVWLLIFNVSRSNPCSYIRVEIIFLSGKGDLKFLHCIAFILVALNTFNPVFIFSFGKRAGGFARRQNECLVLEPSEMIVVSFLLSFIKNLKDSCSIIHSSRTCWLKDYFLDWLCWWSDKKPRRDDK